MPQYVTKIAVPEVIREYFTALTEVASAELNPTKDTVTLVFEEEDEYALAEAVHDLQGRLLALGLMDGIPQIPRPKRV